MKIRTLMGDIGPEQLGVCDFHDHLIRSGGPEILIDPDYLMDSVTAAVSEAEAFAAAGGQAMVCMDPLGCGRNVPKMLEVAERVRGRLHLVMATGFLLGKHYDPRQHWTVTCPEKQVARMLSLEITEGMDRYSYNGPIVERVSAKAGVLKAGTSYQCITPFEQRVLRICAHVQQETGVLISTHTQMGTMGMETLKLLREHGADLSHVVLCHTQKNPGLSYLQHLLDTGASLCFDGPNRPNLQTDDELAQMILRLIERGYQKQIVLGMDAGRASCQHGYMKEKGAEAKGIAYMLTDFVPLLKEMGVPHQAVDDLLVKNPARLLSMI